MTRSSSPAHIRPAGYPGLAAAWHVWEVRKGRQPQIGGDAWDEMVSAVDGCVTQTSAWVEYALATDYQRAVLVAGVDAEGAARAAAVGFVSEPRWPLRGFRTMRFPAYPSTCGDVDAVGEAVGVCEQVARAHGCMRIEFGGLRQPTAPSVAGLPGYATRDRLEYVVDLTCGKEELWAALNPDQRKNVKLSRTRGVYVVQAASPVSVQVLRALQVDVSRRHAAKGDGFGLQSPAVYDAMGRALLGRGVARVYCALVRGAVVMAALLTTFGQRARGISNGANELGLETRASTAVIWHIIAQLSQEGFAELSFGTEDPVVEDPSAPNHGLHKYKLELGAKLRHVTAASKDLRPVAARAYRALQQVRARMSNGRRRTSPAQVEVEV